MIGQRYRHKPSGDTGVVVEVDERRVTVRWDGAERGTYGALHESFAREWEPVSSLIPAQLELFA